MIELPRGPETTRSAASRAGRLGVAATLSAVLVMPLALLELRSRATPDDSFSWPLFVVLWGLPFAFILVLPLAWSARHGWLARGLAGAALTALALVWGLVVADQWPCFMGLPNCD